MAVSFARRPLTRRPQGALRFPAGPFRGMRDSLDPTSADPHLARLLQNCYPLDPTREDSAVVGRPGCQQAGSQLGATGKRTGQLVYQFTKRDGTQYTVAIVGGQGIYTFNWSTRAWSQVVTVANLTTASITLSETARVYAVTFTDKMVISDGVNKPFMWDGTSGAGGLTSLTNAPVVYGQPVVYYAKLFGIKSTERSTIVWSEENTPNTGYEAGGFNNAWTLSQTDSQGIYALKATNEALYVFRARSITAITGAVSSTFSTSGVRESVSETIGTTSPAAVVEYERSIYFPDAFGRPQVVQPGLGVLDPPLWRDVRETVTGIDLTQLAAADGWYDPETRLVCLSYVEIGQSSNSASITIAPQTNQPVAVFRGFTFDRAGIVYDASLRQVVMHLSGGYAYDHGTETGTLWDDALNAATQPITHVVQSTALGMDTAVSKQWERLDLSFRAQSDMTLTVDYDTTHGTSTAQSTTLAGQLARWDIGVWDTSYWSGSSLELHSALGWNGFGRWLAWRVSHAVIGEQFGLLLGTVTARALTAAPEVV